MHFNSYIRLFNWALPLRIEYTDFDLGHGKGFVIHFLCWESYIWKEHDQRRTSHRIPSR